MPTFSNAGGSLGSAIVLTLLAWGVKWLRNEISKRRNEGSMEACDDAAPGPYHATVAPTTLKKLLETRAYPHVVLDVRPFLDEENPLPEDLRGAIRLPYDLVGTVLGSRASWESTFPQMPCPDTLKIVVCVGSNADQERKAAAAANSIGYQRTLAVQGSLPGYAAEQHWHKPVPSYISRDGLAIVLSDAASIPVSGKHESLREHVTLIDVRRNDERILFGSINGSKHIPVDILASALQLPPDEFKARHHFPKPGQEGILIMSCRTNIRATWAAQIAYDFGYVNSFVYADGVNGWNLDPSVCAYPGYPVGSAPPEPIDFEHQEVDGEHGIEEIKSLVEVLVLF